MGNKIRYEVYVGLVIYMHHVIKIWSSSDVIFVLTFKTMLVIDTNLRNQLLYAMSKSKVFISTPSSAIFLSLFSYTKVYYYSK